MSKKRKQLRQAQQLAVVVARPARKRPTHPQMPSRCRDPLFGDPLTHGTARLPMRDYDTKRADHRPIHYRLHSHDFAPTRAFGEPAVVTDHANTLGHLEWSVAHLRYLARVKTREQTEWKQWWLVPYVIDKLFREATTQTVGWDGNGLNAVVAFMRDPDALRMRMPRWLEKQFAAMHAYVRAYLLPYEATIAS